MSALGRCEGGSSGAVGDEFEFLKAAEAVSSDIGSKKITLPNLISCSDGTYRFGSEKTIYLHEFLTIEYPSWMKAVEAYSKLNLDKESLSTLFDVVEHLHSEIAFFQAGQQEPEKKPSSVQERQPLLDVATECCEKLETLSSAIKQAIEREENQTEQAIKIATVRGYQLIPITEATSTIIDREWSLSWQESQDLFRNMERFAKESIFLSHPERQSVIASLETLSTTILLKGRGKRNDLAAEVGQIWKTLQKMEVPIKESAQLPTVGDVLQKEGAVFVKTLQNRACFPVVSSLPTGLEIEEKVIPLEEFFHRHSTSIYHSLKREIQFLERELPGNEDQLSVWKNRLKTINTLVSHVGVGFWRVKDSLTPLVTRKPLGYEGIPIFFRTEVYERLDSKFKALYLFNGTAAIGQIQSSFAKLTGMASSQGEPLSNPIESSNSLYELQKIEPIVSFFLTKVPVPSVHFPADASIRVEDMTLLDWLTYQQFFLNQLKTRLTTVSDINGEAIEAPLEALLIHVKDGLEVFRKTLKGKAPEQYEGELNLLSFKSHQIYNTWAKVSLLYQLLQTEVGVKETRSQAREGASVVGSDFELVDNPNPSIRELIERKRRKG